LGIVFNLAKIVISLGLGLKVIGGVQGTFEITACQSKFLRIEVKDAFL